MVCDIIGDFFNTIKVFFIIAVIIIVIVIIIVVARTIKERADDKERERQKNREAMEREIRRKENELKGESRRDKYWNNLCLVYGDKDRDTLANVLNWLQELDGLPEIGEDGYDTYVSQERQECREKIKALLGYPVWIVEGDDRSDSPWWLDLDIRYVKLLLE